MLVQNPVATASISPAFGLVGLMCDASVIHMPCSDCESNRIFDQCAAHPIRIFTQRPRTVVYQADGVQALGYRFDGRAYIHHAHVPLAFSGVQKVE